MSSLSSKLPVVNTPRRQLELSLSRAVPGGLRQKVKMLSQGQLEVSPQVNGSQSS